MRSRSPSERIRCALSFTARTPFVQLFPTSNTVKEPQHPVIRNVALTTKPDAHVSTFAYRGRSRKLTLTRSIDSRTRSRRVLIWLVVVADFARRLDRSDFLLRLNGIGGHGSTGDEDRENSEHVDESLHGTNLPEQPEPFHPGGPGIDLGAAESVHIPKPYDRGAGTVQALELLCQRSPGAGVWPRSDPYYPGRGVGRIAVTCSAVQG